MPLEMAAELTINSKYMEDFMVSRLKKSWSPHELTLRFSILKNCAVKHTSTGENIPRVYCMRF